jgi:F-type H+-transporting ATPase subunit delta
MSEIVYQCAKALFALNIKEDLREFVDLFQKNRDLRHYLIHPQISLDEKKSLLEKLIAEKKGISFLLYVIEKKILKLLPLIFKSYQKLIQESRGQLAVTLITAIPIDASIINPLKKRLDQALQKQSLITTAVDKQILGGIILIFDHRMIDYSTRGRLNRLKKFLSKDSHVAQT